MRLACQYQGFFIQHYVIQVNTIILRNKAGYIKKSSQIITDAERQMLPEIL